ncbi:MAG TPA: HlyD family efflux transporter periplasmic adaptor subunit [Bryobacteraceae bacterium]|nr:HlyD family efflux transporter periplasmic adaptor subunit [Bryobacteraceae bacterium]
MIKYGLPIVAAIALTFAILKIVHSQPVHAKLPPPDAPPSAVYTNQVGAVGLAEAESENIAISLPVPGLVTHVDVKAGDRVRKGARLFSLDDRDLQAELALRQSSLALAETKFEKLAMSPRPEDLPPAEAKVREAEQMYQDAAVQLNLMESVRDKRAIRDEDLQRRRLAAKAAEARLDQAKADLALLKAGTWKPDLDIARAEVAEAQHQVERVQADLSRLIVTAPIDGEILQCKVHPGEYAQAGPLAQPLILMGATARLNVRADIDEQDAWRVKSGATATASVRGNAGQHLPLHFVRVEPYVIPKRNLTGDSTERVDTRVLQVIFALDRGAPVYAGQQLDVFIQAGGQK